MANNRLYIVDRTTGDAFLLAKSFGVGWQVWGGERAVGEAGVPLEERLEAWLDGRDMEAAYGTPSRETVLALACEQDEAKREIMREVQAAATGGG